LHTNTQQIRYEALNFVPYCLIGLWVSILIITVWMNVSIIVYTLFLMTISIMVTIAVRPWLGLLFLIIAGAVGNLGEFPDFPTDIMQAIGFITIGSALLFIMKNRLGYKRSPLEGPILLFVVALIITFPSSNFEVYLPQILSFLTLFILYFVSVQLLDTQYKVYVTLSTFVVISAVIVAICIIFLFAQRPELSVAGRSVLLFYSNKYGNVRIGGTFEQPNTMAQLTAIAVPTGLALTLSARGIKRWMLGVVTGLNAAGTFLTQSRSAILGIMFGIAFLMYLREPTKRLRQYTALALISLGVIIGISITGLGEKVLERLKPETTTLETEDEEKYLGRTLTFSAALESFLEQPWGAGYGQGKHIIGKELGVDVKSAHSVLLGWMVEFGILGLGAALWLIFCQIRMLWQVSRHPLNSEWRMLGAGCLGAVTATWIHNMAHATLHWGLVWLFFAIASSVAILGRQREGMITSGK
jgi:hypothetical protein